MSTRSLESLPVELLFHLLHYLPNSSLISLKLSSRQLCSELPSPRTISPPSESYCEKRARRRYLGERKDMEDNRGRCVLCNVCAPCDEFMEEYPICKTHEGRFMTTAMPPHLEPALVTRLEQLAKEMPESGWVSFGRSFCVHSMLIQNWDGPSELCECHCNSCGHFQVLCYVRIQIPRTSLEVLSDLKSFHLSEDRKHVIEQRRRLCCTIPGGHEPLQLSTDPITKDKRKFAIPVLDLKE